MILKQWFNGAANIIALLTLLSSQSIPTYAQNHSGRPASSDLDVSLLDGAECTNFTKPASIMGAGLSTRKQKVSIGKQFYSVPWTLFASANGGSITLVCEIDPQQFRVLNLQMGASDELGLKSKITVHIYQGGKVKYTHKVTAGTIIDSVLNLSDPTVGGKAYKIAIEVICGQINDRCPLLVLESNLVHQTNFSKQ